jgi:hypothetical protein
MKRGYLLSLMLLAAVLLAPGCEDEGPKTSFQEKMMSMAPPSAKERVAMAFDPKDPDRRREGIKWLSKEKWGLEEPYLKGYALAVQTDNDATVRSAAVRALGKAGDPKYNSVIAEALSDPSSMVRWDAATVLDESPNPEAVEALRKHATDDESMDVRAMCASALKHYHRPDVVRTLIACLDDAAFNVKYAAHESLTLLCRRDLGYNSDDWSRLTPDKLLAPMPDESRPWWDWMGVTKNRSASKPVDAAENPEKPS